MDNDAESLQPIQPKGEETREFYILRPLCVAIMKNPTEGTFNKLQEALSLINDPPAHLADYVLFPFALHLKMLHKYKEDLKITILTCMDKVLDTFEVRSWDMFVEMFQRFHLAVGSPDNPTAVNPAVSDSVMTVILSNIWSLVNKNLPRHYQVLFRENKIQILAHSVLLLLQLAKMNVQKNIRLKAMNILEAYVTCCEGREIESRRFFAFLPGIVSNMRHVVNIKVGRVFESVVIKGLRLLWKTIRVCVKYTNSEDLHQPDATLSCIFSDLSEELLLHDNTRYRKSILEFSVKLLDVTNGKMPQCQEILLNNLLILQSDPDKDISTSVTDIFLKYTSLLKVTYEDIIYLTKCTISKLKSGDDKSCTLYLRKLLTNLTLVKLNFMEIREFLSVIFTLIDETLRTTSLVIKTPKSMRCDPKITLCANVCSKIVYIGSMSDILEEFELAFSNFEGDVENNFLGCIFCFNEFLLSSLNSSYKLKKEFSELSEFEVMNFINLYIAILNMQSTELVLSILESEAPKIQSVIDIRKAYLLQGLGIMAKIYSESCLSAALYPMVEFAGLNDSEIIRDAAFEALTQLAHPKSMQVFLRENLSYIMNELSLRILNLSLHPNCPNALVFLAEHFDFGQAVFVNLVDQVLSRSCDPFCGGHLQHVYTKVFYAFILSLWKHKQENIPYLEKKPSSFLSHKDVGQKTLLQRLLEYQESLGMRPGPLGENKVNSDKKSLNEHFLDAAENVEVKESKEEDFSELQDEIDAGSKSLPADINLALKISHRVLNFLPNSERSVRILAMDCLIKAVYVLENHEDSLLPLAHTVWQNLISRFAEKDYVVVRKSLELLLALCSTCGTFLKKRTVKEIFPKLSSLLIDLAAESEKVKTKNRQYYTYTQAYKLQLAVLQGMGALCEAIDIHEEELDKVLSGCIVYLNPQQHKNLKDASLKLIESLSCGKRSRSVWMKLVIQGLKDVPSCPPHPSFAPLPTLLTKRAK